MPISNLNCSTGSTIEFMEMIKIIIRLYVYVMNMIAVFKWDSFTGHCSKTVIVGFSLWSCDFYTTLNFMNMTLVGFVVVIQTIITPPNILCQFHMNVYVIACDPLAKMFSAARWKNSHLMRHNSAAVPGARASRWPGNSPRRTS